MTSAEPTTRSSEQERTAKLPMPGWSNLTAPYGSTPNRGELVIQRCDNAASIAGSPSRCATAAIRRRGTGTRVPGPASSTASRGPSSRRAGRPPPNLSVIELDGTERTRSGSSRGSKGSTATPSVAASGSLSFDSFDDELAVHILPTGVAPRSSSEQRLRSVQREGEQAWTSCRATTSCPPRHRVDEAAGACSDPMTISACSIS